MNFDQLKNAKVLVTGATGFIGYKLANKLLEVGAKVYGISRKENRNDKTISWFAGDLSDLEFVEFVFNEIRPDFVVHLASHVLGARDFKYVLSTFNSNLVSTINILSSTHKFSCKRLILAGSFEEGNSKEKFKTPSSPYAAAKIAASNYARMFHKLYNTPVCTASIYMVYGPGQADHNKLIPYTILETAKGKSPKLSSGVRMIDWIYVDDVVLGLMHMLIAKHIDGETIELGSGKSVSIREIVDLTVQLVDKTIVPKYGEAEDRPMEQEKNAKVDETFQKIKWKAQTNIEIGLKKTINYYTNLTKNNRL